MCAQKSGRTHFNVVFLFLSLSLVYHDLHHHNSEHVLNVFFRTDYILAIDVIFSVLNIDYSVEHIDGLADNQVSMATNRLDSIWLETKALILIQQGYLINRRTHLSSIN